jgi:hypothetical protein
MILDRYLLNVVTLVLIGQPRWPSPHDFFFKEKSMGGRLFIRAESSLIQSSCRSFIRVIVPYEISKVNFRVETKILVSMSEEI